MLQQLFRGIVYSNLWVGLSVAALSTLSFLRYDDWDFNYVALCLFSTLAFYGYARWVETANLKHISDQSIATWTQRNQNFVVSISLLSGLISVFFWWNLPMIIKWWFAATSVFSSLYTLPAVFNKKGVRYLAGVKLIFIALVWTIVTVTIPYQIMEVEWSSVAFIQHLERFAFILALTIPFDIRDARTDSSDLLTLPMWLGVSGARNVALSAMAIVILTQIYLSTLQGEFLLGELSIYLLCGFLIHKSDRDLPDMYFSFFLEGIPILLAIWTFLKTFALPSF